MHKYVQVHLKEKLLNFNSFMINLCFISYQKFSNLLKLSGVEVGVTRHAYLASVFDFL